MTIFYSSQEDSLNEQIQAVHVGLKRKLLHFWDLHHWKAYTTLKKKN